MRRRGGSGAWPGISLCPSCLPPIHALLRLTWDPFVIELGDLRFESTSRQSSDPDQSSSSFVDADLFSGVKVVHDGGPPGSRMDTTGSLLSYA